MTEWRPRPPALKAVPLVVRLLANAVRTRALYPAGHGQVHEADRLLDDAVRRLIEASEIEPPLVIANSSLYLGSALLARESLSHYRLAVEFEACGITSVIFGVTTTKADLAELASIVSEERACPRRIGGLRINEVEIRAPDEESWEERLGPLRRSYAAALDVVREGGRAAASGKSLDLESAHEVVDGLGAAVDRDPSFALLLSTVESHDDYTHFHMANVCVLAVALGRMIGLSREHVITLGVSGLFHDIGKLEVPEEVLNKVGRLTEEEWRIVQHHPVAGAGLLFATGSGFAHPAVAVALEHHSAYDASGYPALAGRAPSLPSRLVAVADCFDAVTTKRAYRDAVGRHDAMGILLSGAGDGFDPRAVRAFVQMLGPHPIGSLVELGSGEIAVVVGAGERTPLRPRVLVVLDATGTPCLAEERDLSDTDLDGEPAWSIVARVDPERYPIDLSTLVLTGEVEQATPGPPGGLVHEPSFGESHPEDYVDSHHEGGHTHTHDHGHEHLPFDPDVAPFPDEP